MDIMPLEKNMMGHLANVYNEAVERIPHCYPVTGQTFQDQLEPVFSGEATETRHDEAVFVAVENRRLVGFVHAAIGQRQPESGEDKGLIRFLWYRPGNRRAGVALLQAAENHCVDLGHRTVYAFPNRHRYPFYFLNWTYMSDRLGHIDALLGMNGYRRCDGEVYMDWEHFSIERPASLPDRLPTSVEHTVGLGRMPGVTVRVEPDGKEIGICQNVSAGEFSRDRLAQEWTFTNWVAVDKEYQGLGLGRWLLQRALWEAQQMGYRHAAITTAWDNYRAFMFYTNFGFRVANWTYGYQCTLS